MTINHLQAYFCLWLGTKISFLIYSLCVPNWSQSRKNIFQCYATLWILIFMEQNTLLHSSQLSIAVINIILYYNDYGPTYTDTVGWLSVATNTMTHRLRTSHIRNPCPEQTILLSIHLQSLKQTRLMVTSVKIVSRDSDKMVYIIKGWRDWIYLGFSRVRAATS